MSVGVQERGGGSKSMGRVRTRKGDGGYEVRTALAESRLAVAVLIAVCRTSISRSVLFYRKWERPGSKESCQESKRNGGEPASRALDPFRTIFSLCHDDDGGRWSCLGFPPSLPPPHLHHHSRTFAFHVCLLPPHHLLGLDALEVIVLLGSDYVDECGGGIARHDVGYGSVVRGGGKGGRGGEEQEVGGEVGWAGQR